MPGAFRSPLTKGRLCSGEHVGAPMSRDPAAASGGRRSVKRDFLNENKLPPLVGWIFRLEPFGKSRGFPLKSQKVKLFAGGRGVNSNQETATPTDCFFPCSRFLLLSRKQ